MLWTMGNNSRGEAGGVALEVTEGRWVFSVFIAIARRLEWPETWEFAQVDLTGPLEAYRVLLERLRRPLRIKLVL